MRMIKADGPAKVKERLRLNALRMALVLACSAMVISLPVRAGVSEKDVQSLEEQEFGIDSKSERKEKPQDADEGLDTNPANQDVQAEAAPEKVKPIEAEEFKVRATKSSRSGRVWMFEDAAENRPRPGKILLLKDGNNEVAAIRVLKNMPGKFAGKTVLNFSKIQPTQEYRALKKLGDKIISMIKEREKRGKDLDAAKTDEELAKEVSPDDNELDRGIPLPGKSKNGRGQKPEPLFTPEKNDSTNIPKMPEPLFGKDGTELDADSIEVKDEEEAVNDVAVQEELPIEPYRNAVSLEYASIRSVDKNGDPTSYSGFGFRYNFHLFRMPFIKKKTIQDSISAELALFYYRINGFSTPNDAVTVVPIVGTIRYNLLIGENLMLYPYVGFIRNNVSAGDGSLVGQTALLSTTSAALGLGAQLKLGPAWAARVDFGTDLFAIGAVLKF